MFRPGHLRLPARQAKPDTLGGSRPQTPLQIIKWTNNTIIKPSSPAATNRAPVVGCVAPPHPLEDGADVATNAEVDVPRVDGTARQRTGRPVDPRLRRPE